MRSTLRLRNQKSGMTRRQRRLPSPTRPDERGRPEDPRRGKSAHVGAIAPVFRLLMDGKGAERLSPLREMEIGTDCVGTTALGAPAGLNITKMIMPHNSLKQLLCIER